MTVTINGTSTAVIPNAAGNVGIGTSAPVAYSNSTSLGVNGTDGAYFDLMASGSIQGQIFASTSEMRLSRVTSGPLTFYTNSIERMRIDYSSGSVGINSTSPTSGRLVISGSSVSTSQGLRLTGDTVDMRVVAESASVGAGMVGTFSAHSLQFMTNGGRVGQATADGRFQWNTQNAFNNEVISVNMDNYSNGIQVFWNNTGTIYHYLVRNPNGFLGGIQSSGSTVSYVNLSDARLKTNLQEIAGAGERLDALKVYEYDLIKGGKGKGVVAQEAFAIDPYPITIGSGEDVSVDDPDFMPWGADYSKYVPDLIAAVKDLRKENADLKARITALEAK